MRELDFERLWRKLQQLGLNGYEARTYLVMVGEEPSKALEVAQRAQVPRQKIYEVLDCLIEKGFATMQQEKTKLFSAVEPGLAIPNYVLTRGQRLQQEFHEQSRMASGLVEDLTTAFAEADARRGTLDLVRILTEPAQAADQYRRLLTSAGSEYVEFSQPPYAVEPSDDRLIQEAVSRGVRCRLLVETGDLPREHERRLREYRRSGIEVRFAPELPLKLALFDGEQGLLALVDPARHQKTFTSLVFSHRGLGEAFQGLFEAHWHQAHDLRVASSQAM